MFRLLYTLIVAHIKFTNFEDVRKRLNAALKLGFCNEYS